MDILTARAALAGSTLPHTGPLHTAPLCASQREGLLRAARASLRRTRQMLRDRPGSQARTNQLRTAEASLRAEIAELEGMA